MIEELTIHNAAQVLRLHGLRYNIRGCDTWDEDTDDVDPKIQPDLRSELNSYVKTLRKPTSTRRRNEIEQLAPMLRCSHVLKAIPETAKRSLCRTATHRHATRGEKVYSRGDHADAFFVVLRGTVSIEAPSEHSSGGKAMILARKTAQHGFGDLALIENIPRSNDAVVESEEVDLLVLRKEDYQLTMNAYRAEEILKTLAIPTADRTDADLRTLKQFIADKISFFTDNHSDEELLSLCGFMEAVHFDEAGSYVFRQGDNGDGLYIVFSAEVEIVLEGSSGRRSSGLLAKRARKIMRARSVAGSPSMRRRSSASGDFSRIPSIEEGHEIQLFGRTASAGSQIYDHSSSLHLSRGSESQRSASRDSSVSPGRSPDSASPRRTPSSPTESPGHASNDGVVARYSHGEIFGEPSLWLRDSRAASARIASPGYLIKLAKIDYRRVVQEKLDSSNHVLHASLRQAFKIADHASHEFMLKVSNLFAQRTFRPGQLIALQGTPIEDVFVIKSGACAVSLDLKMVRRGAEGEAKEVGQNCKLNIATVGANENVGVADFWANKECWLTSYVASTELTVLQGSMLRVLNLLERHAKDLAAFKYLEALKARGRAQRLRGKLHILAGRGQVAAKRDNAELWVLEELAGAPGEEQRWEAPSESDDASDHDRELHSREKEALLNDAKFAGARLHAAREAKRVRSVVLPKLNLAGVVATRDRIEALATSPTHRFRQRKPAAPRDEEPLYLGLQRVPRGCWLSPKVPRSSFNGTTTASSLDGKFAGQAKREVQRQKDLEGAWRATAECTGAAVSVFAALDQCSTRAQLSPDMVRALRRHQVLSEVLPASRYGGLAFLPRAGHRPRSRNFMLPSTVRPRLFPAIKCCAAQAPALEVWRRL